MARLQIVNSENSKLIKISGRAEQSKFELLSIFVGPVADKFFIVTVLCALYAGPGLGFIMWLRNSGMLLVQLDYLLELQSHIFIQTNLLFGSAIVGFLLQASPKLVGQTVSRSIFWVVASFSLICLSFASCIAVGPTMFVRLNLAASFMLAGLYVLKATNWTRIDSVLRMTFPFVAGLSVMIYSTLVENLNPLSLYVELWGGVMLIVLAAAQQFFVGILGAKKMNHYLAVGIWILILLTPLILFFAEQTSVAVLISALNFTTLIIYCFASQAFKSIFSKGNLLVQLVFGIGVLWAFYASLAVGFGGVYVDSAIHAMTLGFILPLVMVLSLRIVSFTSGKDLVNDKRQMIALAVWQLVPILRCFAYHNATPLILSLIVAVVCSFILISWACYLLKGLMIILRRQLLRGNTAPAPSC